MLKPLGPHRWLHRNSFASVSGPGNGSELLRWLSTVRSNVNGRITLGGLSELRSAMQQQSFQTLMVNILNLARFNTTRCYSNSSSSKTMSQPTAPRCSAGISTLMLMRGARALTNMNGITLSRMVANALQQRNDSK